MSTASTDHVALMLARLPEQMKGLPKWEALVTAFAQQLAEVETAYQELLLERSIETAEGAQLDDIGDIVGQPRNGITDDDQYRRRLRARIAVNRSKGGARDLITVGRLVVDAGVTIEVVQQQVATAVVRVLDTSDDIADILVDYLRDTVASGVRLVLEHSPYSIDDVFTFAVSGYLEDQGDIGDDAIVMREVDGYRFRKGTPIGGSGFVSVSGQVTIDPNTGSEETVSYYGLTHDALFLTAPLVNLHLVGALVVMADSPGEGFRSFDFSEDQVFSVTDEFNGTTPITVPAGVYTATELETFIDGELPAGGANWSFVIASDIATFDEPNGEFQVNWLTATVLRDALAYTTDSGPMGSPYTAPDEIQYTPGYFVGVLE